MIQYELFDGKRYLFSVSPNENPFRVFHEESRRYPQLRMVSVQDGKRTPCEMDSFGYADEEDEECNL